MSPGDARLLRLADLADLCVGRPPAPGAGVRVVALDGPSGSGKTTLAGRLAGALDAPVVHLDDLYPGWDGLEDAVPRLVEWVLVPLLEGRPARYRRYDWAAGAYAEWHQVGHRRLVVVEGVGCGARACAPYLSTLAWLEADPGERFRRGVDRDGERYLPHWQRWAVQEDRHFAAEGTRERADVVLDGGLDADRHAAGMLSVRRWPRA